MGIFGQDRFLLYRYRQNGLRKVDFMKGFFTYIAMTAAFTLVILLAVRHDKKIDPRPAPAPKPERKPLTRSEKKDCGGSRYFYYSGFSGIAADC